MPCALQERGWKLNCQYLKLDGQTSTANRRNHIKRFADVNGPKASPSPSIAIPHAHDAVCSCKVHALKPVKGGMQR